MNNKNFRFIFTDIHERRVQQISIETGNKNQKGIFIPTHLMNSYIL